MFILVLQQCHKENEDKWKRLSRQIADVILPMIAKQQVVKRMQVYMFVMCLLFHLEIQIKLLYSMSTCSQTINIFVCRVLTDAPGLSGGVGRVEHSV